MNNINDNYAQPTNDANDVFSWDSEIRPAEAFEYITLPEGEYKFIVKKLERSSYSPRPGSSIPACPMATVFLEIETLDGEAEVRDNLYLCTKMEWKLSQFFTGIGMGGNGQTIRMDWKSVVGKSGRCKIENEEYNGKIYNRVKSYVKPENDEGFFPATSDEKPLWMQGGN